jgi:hypothetical protein
VFVARFGSISIVEMPTQCVTEQVEIGRIKLSRMLLSEFSV